MASATTAAARQPPPSHLVASAAARVMDSRSRSPSPFPSPSLNEGSSFPSDPTTVTPSESWDGVDTRILTDLARRGLFTTLNTIKEAKTLMLDPSLAGPLGLVSDVTSLKQHGVEKMFWLEPASSAFISQASPATSQPNTHTKAALKSINAPTRSVVYICRPEIKWMKSIAEHIRADRTLRPSSPLQHSYTISFVPHRTEPCLQFLDQETVLSDVSLLDFGLEFVPLDRDLISLEDETAWKRVFADGDHTCIFRSAQALMTLQHAYGLFPRIIGKGNLARRLADLLIRQRREHLASDPSNPALTSPSQTIDSLIILDRSVDLATPLCTQLTYQGLVDEVIGINNAHVEVDPALLTGQHQPPTDPSGPSGSGTPLQMTSSSKKRKHRLDATTDVLFNEIRDLNFAVVGEKLHQAAKRLNEDYDGRHQAKTVQQIRAFVGKLGGLQNEHASLRLHTGLTEKVMEWTAREEFNRMLEIQQNLVAGIDLNAQQAGIEDLINEERDITSVLRLLCLSSIVSGGSGGIKPKNLEFVKREILQTYGYQFLPLLLMLQRVGLLTRSSPSSTGVKLGPLSNVVGATGLVGSNGGFAGVRRSLRLINDDVDERNPADISYVYSGYAPLSVRLVQAVAQKEALLDSSISVNGGLGNSTTAGFATTGGSQRSASTLPRAHPIVGWRGFEDAVNSLAGVTFDEIQSDSWNPLDSRLSRTTTSLNATTTTTETTTTAGGSVASSSIGTLRTSNVSLMNPTTATTPSSSSTPLLLLPPTDPEAITTTLVFFLGGVTYTEIAALRFMSRQTRNRRYLIATTNTIHGDKMIKDLSFDCL